MLTESDIKTDAEIQTKCENAIATVIKKYENDEYMLRRIEKHITKYLPNILHLEFNNYEKRVNRNTFLLNEQQIFIQIFLSKNRYFFLNTNELFYEYDGTSYFIIKEDQIIHKLLSSITKEKVLMQWKYKTKANVIKQIKERSLFDSIPESNTIQNVLNVLYPSLFTCKNSVKYFLTIIGDNILKKNTNLIFLISLQMKKLLNELDYISQNAIGINGITFNFMTKYHENHSYENCRLIKINEGFSINLWRDILKKFGLDLLCVAIHYSKRYENSDNFIESKSDDELKTYAYYLKTNQQQDIVNEFCSKYIVNSGNNYKMEWKNLHFVWKQFLFDNNLPNIIYSNTFKNLIKEKYVYDENADAFNNITSKYLPFHRDFIKFWENNITIHNSGVFYNELEIDELASLFKLWVKLSTEQLMTNGNIAEGNILKILKHFYPNIKIIDDKYILNVSCILWDKPNDVCNSFDFIKEQSVKDKKLDKNSNLSLLSFDDAYNYYYKFCNMNSYKFIVSKRYFEKYLCHKINEYVVYDNFIKIDWVL